MTQCLLGGLGVLKFPQVLSSRRATYAYSPRSGHPLLAGSVFRIATRKTQNLLATRHTSERSFNSANAPNSAN